MRKPCPEFRRHLRWQQRNRRGAIAALVALTVPFLLVLACFALNVAYMEQVREELRIACDSAAKSALVNFGATQNQSTAATFGQTVSNKNLVGGRTLSLASSNFTFGNATKNGSGVYVFTAGLTPLNSVQVIGTVNRSFCSDAVSADQLVHDLRDLADHAHQSRHLPGARSFGFHGVRFERQRVRLSECRPVRHQCPDSELFHRAEHHVEPLGGANHGGQ